MVLPAGLLVVLTVVLSGCGQSAGLPEGPLGKIPENHIVVGQPVASGGADTIAGDGVFNSGSAPAVVDRLVLVSPRHIRLIGAYLTIGGVLGNWVTFPPSFSRTGDAIFIRDWANRHKPAGAIIPPHQWAGITLGLEATGAYGSIAAIDVYYHVGSSYYERHGHVRIELTLVNCRAPSSASARGCCQAVRQQAG